MNEIRGPGELNFESTNLSEAWAKWKRSMQYYLVATCKDRSEDEKVAIFMCMIGRQGQDIRDTFELDEDKDGEEIVTVEILIQRFEQYCKPRKNLIVERHRFLTRNQEQSETIDQYVTELKTLATSCEWGDIKDDLICSRIVSGIVSTRVRERLLREPKLKLTRAIEICQADELSLQQLKLFNNDKEVGAINKTRQPRRHGKHVNQHVNHDVNHNSETRKPKQDRDESKTWKICSNCGNKHPKQKCPAFGRQCNKCKKFNHYGKMCRSSGKLDVIETRVLKPEETGDDYLFLNTITASVDETEHGKKTSVKYATSSTDQLLPKTVNPAIVQTRLEQKQAQQKKYYDRSSKPLEHLSEGDDVYVQHEGRWKPAIITSKAETPRSFNIMTEDGAQYRRNRIHLRKAYDRVSQSSFPEKSTESPSKEEIKAKSPTRDEQLQHQEAREDNKETLSYTDETESPVKTRSGRMIRKPTWYKDYLFTISH